MAVPRAASAYGQQLKTAILHSCLTLNKEAMVIPYSNTYTLHFSPLDLNLKLDCLKPEAIFNLITFWLSKLEKPSVIKSCHN